MKSIKNKIFKIFISCVESTNVRRYRNRYFLTMKIKWLNNSENEKRSGFYENIREIIKA